MWIEHGHRVTAIAALLAAVALVGCQGDDTATTQAPPTTTPVASTTAPTTDATAAGESQVAAVMTAIEAFNAGDVEGWVAAFDPAAEEVEPEITPWYEILMNANNRIDVVEPCQLVEANPALVECTLQRSDDFLSPAGFLGTQSAQFHLNDQLLITDWEDNQICCAVFDERIFSYTGAFYAWLQSNHPDVYEQIKPVDSPRDVPGWKTDPANMAIAIQSVGEFLAQSDTYPISGGSS
jgi:hypothetical protein